MNELISIIINVYNAEKYIAKCVDSIINQTYKNLEIIIINDGSTDNTLKICESYNDSRIRIITQENMGLSKSRNVGIENANGEYLYFVDADDFVEFDVIEYLYDLIKENNCLISTCNCMDIYEYNFKKIDKKEKIKLIPSKQFLEDILLGVGRAGTLWNKLFKKEIFNNIRFEDRIINDVVVVYKLIIEAKIIVKGNKIKYYYLKHSASITANNNEKRAIDFYKAALERYENIKKLYPKFIENDACLCLVIINLFNEFSNTLVSFMIENKLFELYKKLFNFKILFCKMKILVKVRFILFRINPKVMLFVSKVYKAIKVNMLKIYYIER